MPPSDMSALTASQAAAEIARGVMSAEEYTAACLKRIEVVEGEVQAFIHLDPEHALAQARALDERRRSGQPIGPLHGVPVGIKDIFDTADYKTECGSPLHKGRQPARDCAAVARLRTAGAVIIGKTVTTEFAYFHPGKTRNPRDLAHTPGGSSSGSAAAVAAGMIPLAIGTQTGGSMMRPASFCGVTGFKTSYGLLAMDGVLPLAKSLDTLGFFTHTATDMLAFWDAMGHSTGHPE